MITDIDKTQLKIEIDHIFESGANEIRVYEMVVNFINKHIEQKLLKQVVMQGLQKITRVEVIDENGRSYVNWNSSNKVELQIQDEDRTLKVFIVRSPTVGREREQPQD